MDKLLNKHLDEMEDLEASLTKEIDKMIKAINIDAVVDSPEIALTTLTEEIKEIILDRYAPSAMLYGLNLGADIKKKNTDIKIQDSNNPNLNSDKRAD